MQPRSTSDLVQAALDGDSEAIVELHARCGDEGVARQIGEHMLAALPRHRDAVENWVHAIVEMHPDLAVEFGNALRKSLPSPGELP